MEALTVRLLPFSEAGGASNMAADEVLLQGAAAGRAAFRLYRWTEATASLGYFQSCKEITNQPELSQLPFVRRPSGGQTLVHHHEITYALALPPEYVGLRSSQWLKRIHEVILRTLAEFGVTVRLAAKEEKCNVAQASRLGSPSETLGLREGLLCFHQKTCGDLLLGDCKIVGSAQRRHRGALLQHGAVLFRQSRFTPTLPGIEDLSKVSLSTDDFCQAFLAGLKKELSWNLKPENWMDQELEKKSELEREKYRSPKWNEKR